MSKSSGLGANFYVGGVDLSGDTGSLGNLSTPRAVKDMTGIDKSAFERRYLRKDGAIAWGAHWNPDGAHATLSALPTVDLPVMYVHRPTIGMPALSMVGKQVNYDGTEATDGGLDFAIQALANGYGAEWGEMLTDGIAETTGAAAQDGLDFTAGVGTTNFGLQAYLHVFAFVGTSATVAIQDSDDDAATDPYVNVTGAVFSAATAAATSQRLQTGRTQAVKRWLRVNVTGTFTDFDFAVMVVKNEATVLF